MRGACGALVALLIMSISGSWAVAGADAGEGPPDTFVECLAAGGVVAIVDHWLTCTAVITQSERVYGFMTTDDGEQVPVEISAETHVTMLTYAFLPDRTIVSTGSPVIFCMSENAAGTPVPCDEL